MCAPCPPTPAPTYRSKLFLDCCGLVRRAMRDLQEEFGFTIGPGNQAYQVASVGGGAAVEGVSLLCSPCAQFDTLPIALRGPEEMQPGDLVFVSAVYYNTKSEWQC